MSDKLEFDKPEEELHAYADGELSTDQAALFEQRLASDAKLREQLQTIQQLTKDLRSAFDEEIQALDSRAESPVLLAGLAGAQKTETIEVPEKSALQNSQAKGTRNKRFSFALAACLMLGLLLGALIPFLFREAPQQDSWLTQMASYQAMYTSDTLKNVIPDTEGQEKKLKILVSQLGSRFDVPDLRQEGVEFRRGQTLTSYGKPVIQLAYLTTAGQLPVAVCLTPQRDEKHYSDNAADNGIQSGNFDDLNYVHWLQGDVEIAIMARLSDKKLRKLQRTVKQQILSGV